MCLFDVLINCAGLRLSRSRVSRSDQLGSAERQPSEIPSRTRSVSAFHLSGPSTGPRSSADVRSEPQPRAKMQGQATTPSLFRVQWNGVASVVFPCP
jgi:hypothetical protein